jgi:Na+/melibiose symporter-like transporter
MNALAILVFGVFIVLTGYESGVTVTAEMQNTIFISITLVPALSCVLSAVPFFFYRLGGAVPAGANSAAATTGK